MSIFNLICISVFSLSITTTAYAAESKGDRPLNLEIPQDFLDSYHEKNSRSSERQLSVVIQEPRVVNNQDVLVLGVDSETALRLSGVQDGRLENDSPCSSAHNQGDFANNWCHAYFSKLAYTMLRENGYNNWVSHAAGLSVFLIKETTDKNFDWADVNTAPIGGLIDKKSEAYITFMLDGSFYIEYRLDLD